MQTSKQKEHESEHEIPKKPSGKEWQQHEGAHGTSLVLVAEGAQLPRSLTPASNSLTSACLLFTPHNDLPRALAHLPPRKLLEHAGTHDKHGKPTKEQDWVEEQQQQSNASWA